MAVSSVAEDEVRPFRPASSSLSQSHQAIETSAAVVRPTYHSQPSQSLRPSEFSASHTAQSTPRSQTQLQPHTATQLSPSSQQSAAAASSLPLFAPPAASSAPRVSILKLPGERKPKKDWDAIRAAKQAAVSPHHNNHSGSKGAVAVEEKQLDEEQPADDEDEGAAAAVEEQKEQHATPNGNSRKIIRTQSSSSQQRSQPHRLTRPLSIPIAATAAAHSNESPPSQSPSNGREAAQKPAKLSSAAGSRQNSFHSGGSRKKKRRTSHQGMMSKLALQFPAVQASFAAVYSSFQQFCQLAASDQPASAAAPASPPPTGIGALGHISLDQFPALLSHLTHSSSTFTAEQALSLFAVSRIEHSATLTFRECLIAIALGYYLAPAGSVSPQAADPNFDKIARGFRVIRAAFDEIDDDASGMLSADEMKQALFAASSGQSRDDVLQARFKELDINGDGDVEFKEFLYGVVSWVGMTSEEELDDIEQSN